jgi:predicted MFS family arabinose efflux permease
MTLLFRVVWGSEVDRALRPVLAVGLVSSIAGGTAYPFLGIWAIDRLGASPSALSVGFLCGALAAGAVGYVGGHLSDHLGRRPLILAGWAGQALTGPALVFATGDVVLGLVALASFGATGALGQAADTAMVADLVPPERHEAAYAAVRVANNLGVSIGPPLGGLLLFGHHWTRLWLGMAALSAIGWLIALRYIPRSGRYKPEERPQRGSLSVIRRDYAFLVFAGSTVLAAMTYVAYETLLPISLVASHGMAPSTWGFLLVVNPILVTFVQLRLTRALAGIPAPVKLAVAMPLMGLPFLVLTATAAIPVVAALIVLFVIGEMLWIPSSQSIVAAFAPADIRGAYMGVIGSAWAVAWAIGPFVGLQVRAGFGDTTMWASVAAISVVAAVSGAAAGRGKESRPVEAAMAA